MVLARKAGIAHVWNFEPLLKFLGLDVKGDIHVAKNASYMSNKSIQDSTAYQRLLKQVS